MHLKPRHSGPGTITSYLIRHFRGTDYFRKAIAGLTLLALAASAQAPLDIRVALVIGNGAYAGYGALANPVHDAQAMAETLKQLGFSVVELRDARKSEMSEAIDKVRKLLDGQQGVGMLYYAGHGLQLDWHNYMVPVDAKLWRAVEVPTQAIDVNAVIDAFKSAGNRMNIVVLDACRDNPFSATGAGKGLVQQDAPPGTFLAYATAPGNVAEDGDVGATDGKPGNGLYTEFLLLELKKPIAKIEDVFKRVRFGVRQRSQGRQIPWESTSLEDDFYFNDGRRMAQGPEEHLSKQQQSEQAFAREKADWDQIKDSQNADDFYAYLQKYPSGFVSEQAQLRLEQLHKALTIAVANRDGVVAPAPAARRFHLGDKFVTDQIDGFTKQRRRTTATVTFADDHRVEFDHGWKVLDQSGAVLKNHNGSKSPGNLESPADMALGKKWRSAFQNLRPDGVLDTNFWDFRVQGYDTVTVPAGTFKAYLVIGAGEARGKAGMTFMESRTWFDPSTLYPVRMEWIYRSKGQITSYGATEAVSFKPGAG